MDHGTARKLKRTIPAFDPNTEVFTVGISQSGLQIRVIPDDANGPV